MLRLFMCLAVALAVATPRAVSADDDPPAIDDAPLSGELEPEADLLWSDPVSTLLTQPSSSDLFSDGDDPAAAAHVLLFSGVDIGSFGAFLHGGALWSPDGLSASGFTFKALAGIGTYRYVAGATGAVPVAGAVRLASLLPGWRFKAEAFELVVAAGLDLQEHRQSPVDPFAYLSGRLAGLRLAADLWYEPTPGIMIASSVSASTIGFGYWSRAATGIRVFDRFWVGPEALVLGDARYHEYRAGLHLTALKTGALEWAAGGGWSADSDHRRGYYARLGVLWRR